jgi:hypothetical protein
MTARAELRRRPDGVALSATRVAAELATISRDGLEVSLDGSMIRARIALERAEAFGFPIEVHEDRVVGRVVPPFDAIVNWTFLELGRRLHCDVLIDDQLATGDDELAKRVVLGSALSDVQDFERRALVEDKPAIEKPARIASVRAFIEALAEDGDLEIAEGHDRSLGVFEDYVDKPDELYTALLDSPAVDEIFLDEAEFKKRWRKVLG